MDSNSQHSSSNGTHDRHEKKAAAEHTQRNSVLQSLNYVCGKFWFSCNYVYYQSYEQTG